MKKLYFSFLPLFLFYGFLMAQVSGGGRPVSFDLPYKALKTAQKVQLQKPNIEQLLQEDDANDRLGKLYRVGHLISVNLSPTNAGTWSTLSDGSRVWQLVIQADGALALGLYFSEEVDLPKGAKLYAFNSNKNHILGSYTSATPKFQAMQMVEGEQLTLEYHAPQGTVGLPTISINEVAYFYRGVEDFVADFSGNQPSRAQSCQVDVACSPENNGWADQIRSVVHFTFNQGGSTFVCSAATINNTANDCKPYILTAWHCGERSAGSSINSWVWYWNYQKATCQPNSNSVNPSKGTQTMTGGNVRASAGSGTLNNPPGSNQVAGSDFYLVELNAQIPTTYNPYFAGWDRNNTAATSGVSIHHPNGSAKKISTFTAALTNTSFNGGGNGHFWRVIWSATTNGHGVTEGGSSGSPIFNQNKRIVGQLTGGSSSCTATTSPDVYGKLRSDWDLNGTTDNARLSPWLDPTNSGVTVLDGHSCTGGSSSYCTASATHTCGTGEEHITRVQLNTINNPSACNNYSNFTGQSTNLGRGQQFTISISTGIVGSTNVAYVDNQIAAWIDYNQNNAFETNERLGLVTVAQGTSFPVQFTFVVPTTASLGSTRLRVRLSHLPTDGSIEPCNPSSGPYAYGETEDYTVVIQNTSSLEDEELSQILVYPNPNKGLFYLDASALNQGNISWQVYNLQGALIEEAYDVASGVIPVNLGNSAPGIYFLQISAGDFVWTRKVVVTEE